MWQRGREWPKESGREWYKKEWRREWYKERRREWYKECILESRPKVNKFRHPT